MCGPEQEVTNSVISVQAQTFGETVPIAGLPFTLNYKSDRVPGNKDSRTHRLKLTKSTVTNSLTGVSLVWKIAGRSFHESFLPLPDLTSTFTWDGKDAFGRDVGTAMVGEVAVTYTFGGEYALNAYESFQPGFGAQISGDIFLPVSRTNFTVIRKYSFTMDNWSSKDFRGWTLSEHHHYDPVGKKLHLGSGETLNSSILPDKVGTIAGGGAQGFQGGDGGPAALATFGTITALATATDGTIFIGEAPSDNQPSVIRRIDPRTSIVSTIAGVNGFQIPFITDLEAIDSNSFLIVTRDIENPFFRAVYRFQNGSFLRVIGATPQGSVGEGVPAQAALETSISGVAIDKSGDIYISTQFKIRRISNGLVHTIAGGGSNLSPANGSPALSGAFVALKALFLDSNSNLYFSVFANDGDKVWRINKDGTLYFLGGNGPKSICELKDGDKIQEVFLRVQDLRKDFRSNLLVQEFGVLLSVLPDDSIQFIAGQKARCAGTTVIGDGGSPIDALVNTFSFVGSSHNQTIFSHVTNGVGRIRKIAPPFPESAAGFPIASSSGTEFFVFDNEGRHIETRTSLTGVLKFKFDYDEAGYLAAIHDIDDNITTISRDSNKDPISIVSPDGVQTNLTVGSDGFLSSVSNQEGDTFSFLYYAGGLLSRFNKPSGNNE